MFKIGDFSQLSRVSVKALRLYDQLGLLKPAYVDHFTSYRYYCAQQLPRLNRILALKDLGFSLEQIAQLLDDQISLSQMQGMLRLKQAELQQLVETQTARLLRVEARLKQIELEKTMPNYEITLKKVEPIQVLTLRDQLPSYPSVGRLFDELREHLKLHKIKSGCYWAAIWHDAEYRDRNIDGEAVVSVETTFTSNERIKVSTLPGFETMACVVHHGSFHTLNHAYTSLLSWIETNGYQIVGANREVYLHAGNEQDNESYVTEVQFPVEKN